jgi:hypothetical protein
MALQGGLAHATRQGIHDTLRLAALSRPPRDIRSPLSALSPDLAGQIRHASQSYQVVCIKALLAQQPVNLVRWEMNSLY